MNNNDVQFKEAVIASYPTGSRYICNPAPTDTDNDTVILVNGFYDWPTLLEKDGWVRCTEGEYIGHDSEFLAFRKGEENYIVTEDPQFYSSYVKATEGAKALNLLNKEDRIALFQAVANTKTQVDGEYQSHKRGWWNDSAPAYFHNVAGNWEEIEARVLAHNDMRWAGDNVGNAVVMGNEAGPRLAQGIAVGDVVHFENVAAANRLEPIAIEEPPNNAKPPRPHDHLRENWVQRAINRIR